MWYCRISGKGQITDNKENKEMVWNNIPMLRQYFGSPDDPNFHLLEISLDQVEVMTPHQKEPDFISIA